MQRPLNQNKPEQPVEPVIPQPTVEPQTDEDWEKVLERKLQEKEVIPPVETPEPAKEPKVETPVESSIPEVSDAPKEDKPKVASNDVSEILFTVLGDDEETEEFARHIYDADLRPEGEKDDDPKEELLELLKFTRLGMTSKQQKLLVEFINSINKNTEETNKLQLAIKELGLSKIKPSIASSKTGPKVLSGDAAMAAVISRTKGVFRIPLYNSGFWVSIKPPTLSELDMFIKSVDTELKEFGRILGAHYHLIFNILIKQKLIDLLLANIVNSNLEGFKDRGTLLKAISLHDYDTIAWGFSTIMYTDGVTIGTYCTNKECGHVSHSQHIDLAKCSYLNHDVFNKDAVKWMLDGFMSGDIKRMEDIEMYKSKILKVNKTVKDDNNHNAYTLEVPSLDRYFSIGLELLDTIINNVHGEKDISKETLYNELNYNIYKMLTPWVSKLTMYDDKGNVEFITSDSNAIMESLDIRYGETNNIFTDVQEFVKETKVNYIATISLKCPNCGKVPNFTKDNMFPIDIEQTFFGLSYLRLGRIGQYIKV